jgi:hypothetical protein
MSQNWVARIADEERRKDQAHTRDLAAALHHAEVVRFHLQYVMFALKERVERDVAAFARELPDRRISFEERTIDGGFTVRRDCYPEGHLTVTPHAEDGTIHVQYLFASEDGVSAPTLLELTPADEHGLGMRVKGDPAKSFTTIEQASEHVLLPLFTGRIS